MLRRLSTEAKAFILICLLLGPPSTAWALNWAQSAIEGPDSNSDGIRDDVGEYIHQRWQDPQLRFWAGEAARGSQAYLASEGNRYALHRAHAFMERARRCLAETRGQQVANQVINSILNAQLDSYERKQRYKEAVDAWLHKVSRDNLPSQPDDQWDASCERADGSIVARHSAAPQSAPNIQATDEELPPPNFFITKAKPREATETGLAPASIEVIPLPTTSANDADSSIAEENTTQQAPAGGWTTYSPRQPDPRYSSRPKPAEPRVRTRQIPRRKLQRGESAAVAATSAEPRPAAAVITTQPSRSELASRTSPASQAAGEPDIPAALRDLAPYIESIEVR